MCWFPFYVSVIGSKFILFGLMVEYETVVFVGQAFDVLVEKELYDVVLFAV
jgi:hypothetical protein